MLHILGKSNSIYTVIKEYPSVTKVKKSYYSLSLPLSEGFRDITTWKFF